MLTVLLRAGCSSMHCSDFQALCDVELLSTVAKDNVDPSLLRANSHVISTRTQTLGDLIRGPFNGTTSSATKRFLTVSYYSESINLAGAMLRTSRVSACLMKVSLGRLLVMRLQQWRDLK